MRAKANYVVLRLEQDGAYRLVQDGLANARACEGWMKKHGADGIDYQPASFIGPLRVVTHVVETKRILALATREARDDLDS